MGNKKSKQPSAEQQKDRPTMPTRVDTLHSGSREVPRVLDDVRQRDEIPWNRIFGDLRQHVDEMSWDRIFGDLRQRNDEIAYVGMEVPKLFDAVQSQLPADWDQRNDEMRLVDLDPGDEEFIKIINKMPNQKVSRIVRIENPYLWGMYQLKKEECIMRSRGKTKECQMWHVTNPKFVKSIAENNFDWRRTKRCKYGKGVCFSPKLDHALKYSTNHGVVILAKVLVGNNHVGHYGSRVPSDNCDSTTGWNGNVYVKYMDHEFFPEYVAYLQPELKTNGIQPPLTKPKQSQVITPVIYNYL